MGQKITTNEACERLRVSRHTLWKYRREGIVSTYVNVKGKLRFDEGEIDAVFYKAERATRS